MVYKCVVIPSFCDKNAVKAFIMDIKRLLIDGALYNKYYNSASEDRKNKVDNFIKARDKALSLGAEILLYRAIKIMLKVDIAQRDLTYIYGKYGKPALKDFPQFHYNISHSGDNVFLCAAPFEIGCDIEIIDEGESTLKESYKDMLKEIAKGEEGCIKSFDDFMDSWVEKEALFKAKGTGLIGADWGDLCLNKTSDYKKISVAIKEIVL